MKELNLLDQSTSFKVNDTGTIIPFNASKNNQPFGVTKNDVLVFRIKNEMGFLKSVNATVAMGGYIFQLNTKDLVGLVPGTYQVELVVTDSTTNEELIFPDTGFCSFNITDSAMTVTGTQIPTMSLDSFKNELQQYVQNQTADKLQSIENDFQAYVNNLQNSTIKQAQQASSDAQKALNTVNANSSMVTANSTMLQTVSSIVNGIFPGYDLPFEYHSGQITDLNNLPLGIHTINGWVDYMANMTNFPDFAKNAWGTFIVLPIGQPGTKGSWQLYYGGGNNIYTRTRTPGNSTFSSWSKMGGVTGVTNLLLNSLDHNDINWNSNQNNNSRTDRYRGSIINKINMAWNGVGPRLQNLFDRQVVNTDDFYVFSVYAKADSNIQLNNNNAYFFNADNTINVYTDIPNELSKIDTNWHQLQVVFKFNQLSKPQSGKDYIRFELSQTLNDGSVYFTCPKLERGVIASDYSPSPEDGNTNIQQLEKQIAALTQQIASLQKNN